LTPLPKVVRKRRSAVIIFRLFKLPICKLAVAVAVAVVVVVALLLSISIIIFISIITHVKRS